MVRMKIQTNVSDAWIEKVLDLLIEADKPKEDLFVLRVGDMILHARKCTGGWLYEVYTLHLQFLHGGILGDIPLREAMNQLVKKEAKFFGYVELVDPERFDQGILKVKVKNYNMPHQIGMKETA